MLLTIRNRVGFVPIHQKWPRQADEPGVARHGAPIAGRVRMHTCLDQNRINTQTDGNKGLRWIARGGGHNRVQQLAETPMLGAQGCGSSGQPITRARRD
jgi:hypothetical protein